VTAQTWRLAQAGTSVASPSGTETHGAAASHAAAAHGAAHGSGGIDPMHQFEIKRLLPLEIFGLDVSFTNSALFMVIAVGLISLFMIYAMRGHALVPGRLQSTAELSYEFVANMVRENTGSAGMQYFPFIFTLFIFILALNMLGLVPYSFTVTSHIIVTFAMALMVFLFVVIVGFAKNGPGFLKLFVPSGVPVWLLPVIAVLEFFSFLIRPISLSVRLFANMMAGHMMLKVFAAFVVGLGLLGGWAPLLFMVAFTGLELLVAFLQAFVFTVLTCIYLNDALNMHH
jgi:F-type H+-transporting ATPase subunit a